MTSKLRIRLGALDVECEGSEEFLKTELPQLITAISTLYREASPPESPGDDAGQSASAKNGTGTTKIVGTTATLAAKLKVKTGADFVIAACAHLTFVKSEASFTRKAILAEMKDATGYFNENHSKNLSATLKTLVENGKLIEITKGTFALKASEKEALEKQLA